MKTDITVIQKAIRITFDCPHCEEPIGIEYADFCSMIGEPCDWKYSKIKCPECNKEIEIDEVNW